LETFEAVVRQGHRLPRMLQGHPIDTTAVVVIVDDQNEHFSGGVGQGFVDVKQFSSERARRSSNSGAASGHNSRGRIGLRKAGGHFSCTTMVFPVRPFRSSEA